MIGVVGLPVDPTIASDAAVLQPRVPSDQLDEARTWKNLLEATPENIENGKAIPGLVGRLPRNFTDKAWQAARTDGELMWILKNGSPGTDMASFIPLILTEEEAWYVLLYVRSFGRP
jgi:hypothetical protein